MNHLPNEDILIDIQIVYHLDFIPWNDGEIMKFMWSYTPIFYHGSNDLCLFIHISTASQLTFCVVLLSLFCFILLEFFIFNLKFEHKW